MKADGDAEPDRQGFPIRFRNQSPHPAAWSSATPALKLVPDREEKRALLLVERVWLREAHAEGADRAAVDAER